MNAASTWLCFPDHREKRKRKREKKEEQKTLENRANVLLENAQKNHGDGAISCKEY
jgi:hypothetical protein